MKTQAKNNTYTQLFNHVNKHVKHYKEDLIVHDLNSITKRPGIKFLHITRPCGTAIIFLNDIDLKQYSLDTTIEKAIEGQKIYFDHYMNDSTRKAICFFDGESVKKINENKARQIFANWKISQRLRAQIEAEAETSTQY